MNGRGRSPLSHLSKFKCTHERVFKLAFERIIISTMSDDYTGVLLEKIQDQLQRLAEAMADVPTKVDDIDQRLREVESDVKVIKAAVTDQSRQLQEQSQRLNTLESHA